ncbi:tyrosine-type recombinase/integrase [Actinospica robiniae]|uniref:tyrosine-type recombinase/integrase n=1 Tax=Actinospica robiniae TaxID=304901 RepID=UPI000420EB40|nr:tyrosine-type recombinase/integrase [Actinospica robiniae]
MAEAEHRSGKNGGAVLTALGESLIFATPEGEPLDPERVYDHFQHLIERSGLPPVRLHDLRHGVPTYARAAHVDPKTLPEMLGHAGVAFTARRRRSRSLME